MIQIVKVKDIKVYKNKMNQYKKKQAITKVKPIIKKIVTFKFCKHLIFIFNFINFEFKND